MSDPLTREPLTPEREAELRAVYAEGPYEDKTSHAETWSEVDRLRASVRTWKNNAGTWKNSHDAAMDDIRALRARLATFERENKELKRRLGVVE